MTLKDREPLFHIVKRSDISFQKALLIRGISLVSALVVGCLLLLIFCGANPFVAIQQLFAGCFGSKRRFWILLREMALLLSVGLALIPAFRMKFWNLGGNGQILIGSLVTIICMLYMGKAGVNNVVICLVMIPCAILAGAIWAVIPAIFKAFFNTNESLFTLMMNYVAAGLVGVFLSAAVPSGSGTLKIIETGNLPNIGNAYLLTIIVSVILLIAMFIYLKYTKHGYELQVVGESQNTAKYVGINVKFVIIRVMAISGAMCGIVGLLLAGSINHSITADSAKNMGFTAIMVAWLAKFNPLVMVLTAFFITFLSRGMAQVQTAFDITNNSICDIIVGLFYFFIIASEFFINYQIIFVKKEKKKKVCIETGEQTVLENTKSSLKGEEDLLQKEEK